MPVYSYKATDRDKQTVEDTIVATNIEDAKRLLGGQGYHVESITQVREKKKLGISFRKGVPLLEKATLFRYLATMVNAGLPLPEAIEVYGQDSQIPKLRTILHDTQQQLQEGKPLSTALTKYSDSFDKTMISIIQAGELSGTLTKSLDYLARQLYSEYKLKQKVKSAMMYPIIIVSAMGGVGLILVFFVLPKIAPIFLQMDVSLPTFSRVVLEGGLFISQNSILVFSALFACLGLLIVGMTQRQGRQIALKIVSLLPAIQKLIDELDLARFCRTLSTLLSSGVSINEALYIVVSSLSQPKFNTLATIFRDEVQKGKALSDVMRVHKKIFPHMVMRMVATGERTGSVDSMLSELADHYEQEVDSTLNNFTAVLEPILLLLVGVGVGAMVLAVIAPIYSLVGGIEANTPGR